jgi:hypothetical protein
MPYRFWAGKVLLLVPVDNKNKSVDMQREGRSFGRVVISQRGFKPQCFSPYSRAFGLSGGSLWLVAFINVTDIPGTRNSMLDFVTL